MKDRGGQVVTKRNDLNLWVSDGVEYLTDASNKETER